MAAHRPFLGRLSNPVSPHVFSLIYVWCGLVVELEHTGPHASENHLSVPLKHHLSTPISTATHSGCWVGAALLLAAVVVEVVVVECVCVCVCVCVCGGGDGELAGVLFLLLTLPIITAQTNMQYTHGTRNFQQWEHRKFPNDNYVDILIYYEPKLSVRCSLSMLNEITETIGQPYRNFTSYKIIYTEHSYIL